MQKDTMQDNYLRSMQADRDLAKAYFAKSINKTEQQKALESLLAESIDSGILEKTKPYRIADLACGGGTLSYHLASFFPNATFCLMDYNDDALELAKEITSPFKDRVEFVQGDLRSMPFADSSFDLVFCWQSLSWIDKSDIAQVFSEILRLLKPNAHFYASSLFNTEFDVDLYTSICDRTRPSSSNKDDPSKPLINGYYNTYCTKTIVSLCKGARDVQILPFYPAIDFARDFTQKGIGSYTLTLDRVESNATKPARFCGGGGKRHSPHHIGWNVAKLGDFNHQKIARPTPPLFPTNTPIFSCKGGL